MNRASLLAVAALAAALSSSQAHAHEGEKRLCSILPPNDFHLYDDNKTVANITQQLFNEIIDQAAAIYAPIISTHGGRLVIGKNWTDSTVNAYAKQSNGVWSVEMFGGLARRPEVTPDGFALVVCHELGHHLGGYPFYSGSNGAWAATEGQSDYFATQACARALWGDQKAANAAFRADAPPVVKAACDRAWTKSEEQDLCYRSSMAGHSLATLLAAIGGSSRTPAFDTPDTQVVRRTFESHPAGQCRLDTYFNGALCDVAFDSMIIPGKGNPTGNASIEAEQDADRYSCGGVASSAPGLRPACWFKSKAH